MADAANYAVKEYQRLIFLDFPKEDARMVLPASQATNLTVTINFAALLHMADLRLCTLAQWEFRRVVALMRSSLKAVHPELASFLQPKCGAGRQGFCDESMDDYLKCPLSHVRPHKQLHTAGKGIGPHSELLKYLDNEGLEE